MSDFSRGLMIAIRKQAGLKQNQFAKRLGVSRVSVANYETGKQGPSLEVFMEALQIVEPDMFHALQAIANSGIESAKTIREERIAKLEARIAKLKGKA